ncbi:hypothetical protein E2562_024088 [Oryza meyeriana var. granulata]|uniref:Uncharacterized protein n=1 Tax=Oryza meyeriana var. granulata TaxID=110450 RepID=A0A6G1CGK9_9ORYZ|nr:hypothetical protein E2562_024088 [Oryza meyeriana var. granulata]
MEDDERATMEEGPRQRSHRHWWSSSSLAPVVVATMIMMRSTKAAEVVALAAPAVLKQKMAFDSALEESGK